MKAIKHWQAATGKELTWPDERKLVEWLLKQTEAAEAKLKRLVASLETHARETQDDAIWAILNDNRESE